MSPLHSTADTAQHSGHSTVELEVAAMSLTVELEVAAMSLGLPCRLDAMDMVEVVGAMADTPFCMTNMEHTLLGDARQAS